MKIISSETKRIIKLELTGFRNGVFKTRFSDLVFIEPKLISCITGYCNVHDCWIMNESSVSKIKATHSQYDRLFSLIWGLSRIFEIDALMTSIAPILNDSNSHLLTNLKRAETHLKKEFSWLLSSSQKQQLQTVSLSAQMPRGCILY